MIPFVEFVNKNLKSQEHFFALNAQKGHEMPKFSNVLDLSQRPKWLRYWTQLREIYRSEKVILHGLFDPYLTILITLQPWLLRKCYWVIWGGDLYDHKYGQKSTSWHINEFFKKRAIPRIKNIITHIRGDYELACEWYGAKGQWHECFMYVSNLHKNNDIITESHAGINILLGNSATLTNNHIDAIEKLRPFAKENIHIYCPLSYGNAEYAKEVAKIGSDIFGDKFTPLTDFMPFNKYLELLKIIDIAVFNHNRQQGMGNITTLLGLGKKIFMRKNLSSYKTLKHLGLIIGDIENLNIETIKYKDSETNKRIIKDYFSENNLRYQLNLIFK